MQVHPTKGLNPRMTCCFRCGEGIGVVLLGALDTKGTCNNCGSLVYGARGECPQCHKSEGYSNREPIGEHEVIPIGLCDKCEQEAKDHAKIVADGGIYWRCTSCKKSGVIKANEFTAEMRKLNNYPAPIPFGVEFTEKDCPVCGPKEEQ